MFPGSSAGAMWATPARKCDNARPCPGERCHGPARTVCGAPLVLTGPALLSTAERTVLRASPAWCRREAAAGPGGRQPQVHEVGADHVVDAPVALQRHRVLRPLDRQQAPGERLRQIDTGLVRRGGD